MWENELACVPATRPNAKDEQTTFRVPPSRRGQGCRPQSPEEGCNSSRVCASSLSPEPVRCHRAKVGRDPAINSKPKVRDSDKDSTSVSALEGTSEVIDSSDAPCVYQFSLQATRSKLSRQRTKALCLSITRSIGSFWSRSNQVNFRRGSRYPRNTRFRSVWA